jgi:hypothetical protein
MRIFLPMVCALAVPLSSTSIHAQDALSLQVLADGHGFASFSNYSMDRYVISGTEFRRINFDITIVKQPPCPRLLIKFDIQRADGVYLARGLEQHPDELRNVQQGQTYAVDIESRSHFDKAKTVRLWLECDPVK